MALSAALVVVLAGLMGAQPETGTPAPAAPSAPSAPAAASPSATPSAPAAGAALPPGAVRIEKKVAQEKGDVLTMVDGTTVTAPIIKEDADTVWISLAGRVVEIPRTRVKEITRKNVEAAPVTEVAAGDSLFRSVASAGALPEKSPKDLAQTFGEAVVMISSPGGLGSGFIIHPEGYVITNAHVIQGETKLRATMFRTDTSSDAQSLRRNELDNVEIIAVNNQLDLALLKLKSPDGKPFPTVYVQGVEDLQAGQEVFAIGAPLGLERTLTTGVIATTQRNFEGLTFIQTTAQINPGNSGGPLFNTKGEVIGVTNMKLTFMEGLGFAIPARYLRDFIRNRDAFAYDKNNPNSGHNYNAPIPRLEFGKAPMLEDDKK